MSLFGDKVALIFFSFFTGCIMSHFVWKRGCSEMHRWGNRGCYRVKWLRVSLWIEPLFSARISSCMRQYTNLKFVDMHFMYEIAPGNEAAVQRYTWSNFEVGICQITIHLETSSVDVRELAIFSRRPFTGTERYHRLPVKEK